MPAEPCLRCGFCLQACPTYREERQEPFSPRGRVALVRALGEGQLKGSARLLGYLDSCLDCLACLSACPSGVAVAREVAGAKARLRQRLPPPLSHRLLLHHLLPHPGRQRLALLPVRRLPLRPAFLSALPSPPHPLRPHLPSVLPATGQRHYRVGFFLGCAQDLLFPAAARASIEVLRENGAEVVLFPGQRCCGQPLSTYGEEARAKEMARHNLRAMEVAALDAVVSDCATCAACLREYPRLMEDDQELQEKALTLQAKAMEISQFLSRIPLRQGGGQIRSKVTYHHPCHLCRGLGAREEPLHLLRAPGVEVVEMAEADVCCGGAGSYPFRHRSLSLKVLERKTGHIAQSGAELVATSCPACRLQLAWGLKRKGLNLPVVSPSELLWRSYQGS